MFEFGDAIKWSSQAQGSVTEKSGKLVGIIAKGEDGFRVLRRATGLDATRIRGRIKFQGRNHVSNRYLVEVPRGGKSVLSDYYAPPMSVVDFQEITRRHKA